jgi:hypothetical protein
MSPEQLSFMIGSIYGSTLSLLLFRPSRRSRNRRDPFLDCRDHCSAKGPTTPKPSFAELLLPPPRDQDPNWRRSFNHENMNKPSGPPPFRLQRSGYRSINYPDPLPDRRPTNPFNGERIPNPPPREP